MNRSSSLSAVFLRTIISTIILWLILVLTYFVLGLIILQIPILKELFSIDEGFNYVFTRTHYIGSVINLFNLTWPLAIVIAIISFLKTLDEAAGMRVSGKKVYSTISVIVFILLLGSALMIGEGWMLAAIGISLLAAFGGIVLATYLLVMYLNKRQ